jgi:urease subunit alpha
MPRKSLLPSYIELVIHIHETCRIPTPEPVIGRVMFGGHSSALSQSCLTFVSQYSVDTIKEELGLKKRVEAVKNCRSIGKKDLKHNSYTPKIVVDPETYQVYADGQLLKVPWADSVPMSQNVYLF